VDLYAYWFSRALAGRLAPTLLRSTPLLIVALLFLGAAPPPSLASFAIWLAATAGAFLLSAAITTLFSIVMLWTISGEGVNQVMPTLVFIGSGMIIPLPLFPDWIQPALNVLPFRHLIDTPFRLYIGHIPPREGLMILLEQLLWLAVLIVGSRWLLGRGVRRLIVHGG
jgi:ABC-2 type transport system permease protein